MKLGYVVVAMVMAGGLATAQDLPKSKTKISVEDGKNVTATGCVARSAEGEFTLTNAANNKGALGTYVLAGDTDDLEKHLGHRVEISGKAADRGKGKISVETKSESRKPDGDKAKTETKSEMKGDLNGLPYLGVKSLRMIAAVCP